MEAELLSDYQLALRLDKELNGSETDADELDVNANIENRAVNNQSMSGIIVLSDDETEPPHPVPARRFRSRSPLRDAKAEVSIENQQAITIQKERKSRNDFFMPLINTYIDLDYNQEWSIVNMESNVQQMFDKMKDHYFGKWLKLVEYTIKWDKTGVISDDSCFKIFESHKQVLIKDTAMVRPRIQLVSILFHVLIHVYLATCSKNTVKMNVHDEIFRKLMLFLNETLGTQISTFHKFLHSADEAEYSQQWYQCTGICLAYEPFHGAIRCASIPDESHTFFHKHEEACGGQFFRIFEMSRNNPETDETENKYVRNVRYMFPKTRQSEKSGHLKTSIQVRELFDLTDDSEDSAVVHNLCDVINLDDSEYNLDLSIEDDELLTNFTKQMPAVFAKCPFCTIIIGSTRLAQHFDKCRGYQQKVVFHLPRK